MGIFVPFAGKVVLYISQQKNNSTTDMLKKWALLKSTIVFDNKWYTLRQDIVRLPSGKVLDDYFVSVRPEVVLIFAMTLAEDVLLVRQYKHGLSEIVTELPGGFFDKESELPEVAAQRELWEETGFRCEHIQKLAILCDNPTKDTNKIHVFLAKGCVDTGRRALDETEEIEVVKVPIEKLHELIINGEFYISGSVAAVFMALHHLKQ